MVASTFVVPTPPLSNDTPGSGCAILGTHRCVCRTASVRYLRKSLVATVKYGQTAVSLIADPAVQQSLQTIMMSRSFHLEQKNFYTLDHVRDLFAWARWEKRLDWLRDRITTQIQLKEQDNVDALVRLAVAFAARIYARLAVGFVMPRRISHAAATGDDRSVDCAALPNVYFWMEMLSDVWIAIAGNEHDQPQLLWERIVPRPRPFHFFFAVHENLTVVEVTDNYSINCAAKRSQRRTFQRSGVNCCDWMDRTLSQWAIRCAAPVDQIYEIQPNGERTCRLCSLFKCARRVYPSRYAYTCRRSKCGGQSYVHEDDLAQVLDGKLVCGLKTSNYGVSIASKTNEIISHRQVSNFDMPIRVVYPENSLPVPHQDRNGLAQQTTARTPYVFLSPAPPPPLLILAQQRSLPLPHQATAFSPVSSSPSPLSPVSSSPSAALSAGLSSLSRVAADHSAADSSAEKRPTADCSTADRLAVDRSASHMSPDETSNWPAVGGNAAMSLCSSPPNRFWSRYSVFTLRTEYEWWCRGMEVLADECRRPYAVWNECPYPNTTVLGTVMERYRGMLNKYYRVINQPNRVLTDLELADIARKLCERKWSVSLYGGWQVKRFETRTYSPARRFLPAVLAVFHKVMLPYGTVHVRDFYSVEQAWHLTVKHGIPASRALVAKFPRTLYFGLVVPRNEETRLRVLYHEVRTRSLLSWSRSVRLALRAKRAYGMSGLFGRQLVAQDSDREAYTDVGDVCNDDNGGGSDVNGGGNDGNDGIGGDCGVCGDDEFESLVVETFDNLFNLTGQSNNVSAKSLTPRSVSSEAVPPPPSSPLFSSLWPATATIIATTIAPSMAATPIATPIATPTALPIATTTSTTITAAAAAVAAASTAAAAAADTAVAAADTAAAATADTVAVNALYTLPRNTSADTIVASTTTTTASIAVTSPTTTAKTIPATALPAAYTAAVANVSAFSNTNAMLNYIAAAATSQVSESLPFADDFSTASAWQNTDSVCVSMLLSPNIFSIPEKPADDRVSSLGQSNTAAITSFVEKNDTDFRDSLTTLSTVAPTMLNSLDCRHGYHS